MTNSQLQEFTEYCLKNNIPSSIAVYALWNAWKESEEALKIAQLIIDTEPNQ